jgi:hypothetical protein
MFALYVLHACHVYVYVRTRICRTRICAYEDGAWWSPSGWDSAPVAGAVAGAVIGPEDFGDWGSAAVAGAVAQAVDATTAVCPAANGPVIGPEDYGEWYGGWYGGWQPPAQPAAAAAAAEPDNWRRAPCERVD